MKIIATRPPNYDLLWAHFGPVIDESGTLFTYGNAIYNPSNHQIPFWLMRHEQVHSARQRHEGVDVWWKAYIESKPFRLMEELLAHRLEYQVFCQSQKVNRHTRQRHLHIVSARLSSRLYGNMLSFRGAKDLITTPDTDKLKAIVDKGWATKEEEAIDALDGTGIQAEAQQEAIV